MARLPLPGLAAAALILLTVAAALGGLLSLGGSGAGAPWGYAARIAWFTALQAAASTLASLALGTVLARALARRPVFPGRAALLALLGAASALPALLIVFGLTALYGRSSPLHALAAMAGIDSRGVIYGLSGIVFAHALMNAPMAARILLRQLEQIPGEHWRLAASLSMSGRGVFRAVEWPLLKSSLPPMAALIFLLCATSFAVPLTLGGGPGYATLEVAIYEALRFEADFSRAALLSLLQIALAGALVLLAARALSVPESGPPPRGIANSRPDGADRGARLRDGLTIAAGALLIAPPLLALLAGLRGLGGAWGSALAAATMTSMSIALASAALAASAALLIALSARAAPQNSVARPALQAVTLLPLAVPPFALAAGLYVLVRGRIDPGSAAMPLTIMINAMMALPFAFRFITPPLEAAHQRYGRIAASLGMGAAARFRLADWPLVKRPLAAAFAAAAAFSFGDLGVFALFAASDMATLPYLLYQALGAYRLAEAEAVAAWMLIIFILLFALSERAAHA